MKYREENMLFLNKYYFTQVLSFLILNAFCSKHNCFLSRNIYFNNRSQFMLMWEFEQTVDGVGVEVGKQKLQRGFLSFLPPLFLTYNNSNWSCMWGRYKFLEMPRSSFNRFHFGRRRRK